MAVLSFAAAIFVTREERRNHSDLETKNTPPTPRPIPERHDIRATGIDRQYQNKHVNMVDRHPVLDYQFAHNKGITPATLGDPIRIMDVAGPVSSHTRVEESLMMRPNARPYIPGPYPGQPIGVPVPAGTLKLTGYGPIIGGMPAVGRADGLVPFRDVDTPWQKVGILTAGNEIMNLYMRYIAPNQDLWEYQVEDKNGFFIRLRQNRYLEDGDEIRDVIGKHGMGPWKVHIFVQNRYIWV